MTRRFAGLGWLPALAAVACAAQKAEQKPTAIAPPPAATVEAPRADGHASPRAERIFSDANEVYGEQEKNGTLNFAELERRYQEAADADSMFGEPLYNLGLLLQREGKVDLASAAYAEALRRNPALVRASESLALIEVAQGKDAEAVELLTAAAKVHSRDAGVRARLAELSLRQADSERARTWAREALMRDSRSIVAYRVLLEIALRQGEDDMVRLLALRAQKAQPQDPLPAYYLGRLALRRKDPQNAVTQFRAALALRPDFEPALIELANVSLSRHDFAGAEVVLRKVLQINPRACPAHLDLGVCEKGLGRFDAAAAEYAEALKCDPKLIQAHYDLGLLQHHQRNDCTAAIESYREFISGNSTPLPAQHPVFAALQECQEHKASEAQRKPEPTVEKAPASISAVPADPGPAAAPAAPPSGPAPTPAAAAPAPQEPAASGAGDHPSPQSPPPDPSEPRN